MDIEIRPHSQIRDFLDRLHSRFEDLMFSVVLHLPEWMMSDSLMEWLDHYTNKRIAQLRQQTTRQAWDNMHLEDVVQEISEKQTKK
jgi:hypothetical protein